MTKFQEKMGKLYLNPRVYINGFAILTLMFKNLQFGHPMHVSFPFNFIYFLLKCPFFLREKKTITK
jgi:hypothetical protein